jgi:hypothetical protein
MLANDATSEIRKNKIIKKITYSGTLLNLGAQKEEKKNSAVSGCNEPPRQLH